MRLLVAGASGQVARSLCALSSSAMEVIALGRPRLDVTERSSIDRAIADCRADAVVNAAAYTNVDRAESDTAIAFAVNRDGAGHVAAAARKWLVPVIHLSTDYVFSGRKAGAYVETDETAPQNAYGRSKREGEIEVAALNPDHAILRTSWVYSPYGRNFLTTMLELARARDVVRVVADQQGAPTYAHDLAVAVVAAARRMVESNDSACRGVFHVVAQGRASWSEFAEEIFRRSAAQGGPTARVEPISTTEHPTAAKRPLNSELSAAKFRLVFEHSLPPWRTGVVRCLAALVRHGARTDTDRRSGA
jgi:dTDP-4-dehydrorhamnose reductase